jgi:dienelactone hydrolase
MFAGLSDRRSLMRKRMLSALVVGCTALASVTAGPAASAKPSVSHHSGKLADGATWIADVPARWNGRLLLFSHGFGPLVAQDAPSQGSATALLDQGYALAGSSYDPNGSMWALNSAVRDQYATLAAFSRQIGRPKRTIAVGQSMGGLVNTLIAQHSAGRIAGAVTFCGIVAGGVALNDYQLNGEYALTKLLPGAAGVQIRDYTSAGQGAAAGSALAGAVTKAQATPSGRARIALAAALLNETDWATGTAAPRDYAGQEAQEEQTLVSGQLVFIESGRYAIEQSAGGDSGSNIGVDYARLIRRSRYYHQIRALYRKAGLSLDTDLTTLTRGAHYRSEGSSLPTMERTSTNSGRLPVPELDVHTISDQLVPVEQENAYALRVRAAGDAAKLRQSYVAAIGHCNFTDAEYVAAIDTVAKRITTGRWGFSTTPAALNAAADSLGPALGGGAFVHYRPSTLVWRPNV